MKFSLDRSDIEAALRRAPDKVRLRLEGLEEGRIRLKVEVGALLPLKLPVTLEQIEVEGGAVSALLRPWSLSKMTHLFVWLARREEVRFENGRVIVPLPAEMLKEVELQAVHIHSGGIEMELALRG